ncbi:hypothetical protein EAE91_18925 [Photorhabdus noenieputensis]|nr:hypothetical protein [Photorhabdus noenieputensis]
MRYDIPTNRSIALFISYTLWISRWIAAARERIPGNIDNYVTGVSAATKGNLKDNGYIRLAGLVNNPLISPLRDQ